MIQFGHHSFKWYRNLAKLVAKQFNPIGILITFYSIVFMSGIFLGEIASDFGRIAEITGMLSTLVVLVLGFDVIYRCWHKNSFLILVASSLILANFSEFSQTFSGPVTRILFHIATALAVSALFYMVHIKKIVDDKDTKCDS